MVDKVGFDLTGKVALVTGAGRGLGAQISEDILRAGGSVMLAARKRPDELMGN
jgi:gluconate 5-dehydrogenase